MNLINVDKLKKSMLIMIDEKLTYSPLTIEDINNIPTISVTNCKDCIFAEESVHPNCIICSNLGVTMNENDFCSQGEKRNGNS